MGSRLPPLPPFVSPSPTTHTHSLPERAPKVPCRVRTDSLVKLAVRVIAVYAGGSLLRDRRADNRAALAAGWPAETV